MTIEHKDVRLPNKPLAEAIFEFRWALDEKRGQGIAVDPGFRLLLGRYYDRVKGHYPHVVDLPTAQIPEDLPLINIDSARIEVVLHNLVANALAYGGEGEVRITAERRGDGIIVSVADNGPGIAPDELPHVFERFYRARHGRRQHSGGTGLGLTICKAFVEAHGGTIWAESSMQGTTISFLLPLVSPAIAAVPVNMATT